MLLILRSFARSPKMIFTTVAYILLLTANEVAAHGLITRINGANGVTMPGLTGT